ncbi:MAG TPA: hypothetical protein VFS47_15855 [Steroidobacteraceae bacterium]|jgi:hypothetical protein|nr:hypothetical protein [Steroidobacteraceae bacterium]
MLEFMLMFAMVCAIGWTHRHDEHSVDTALQLVISDTTAGK